MLVSDDFIVDVRRYVARRVNGGGGGVGVGGGRTATGGSVGLNAFDHARERDGQQELRTSRDTQPRDVFDGVALGTIALARGIWDGLTDVYTQVRRSAAANRREDELAMELGGRASDARRGRKFGRVMQGVGRGLLGTVVKPAVGVIDAATKVLDGVRNSTRPAAEKRNHARSQVQLRRQRAVYVWWRTLPSSRLFTSVVISVQLLLSF